MQMQIFSYKQTTQAPGDFDEKSHHLSRAKYARVPVLHLYCKRTDDNGVHSSVLLHVHNAFNYFFVQVPDALLRTITDVDVFVEQTARIIDTQFIANYPQLSSRVSSVIHDIRAVRAKAFTGYQPYETLFLKIYVSDDRLLKPLTQLLRSGAAFCNFQVYETHITLFMKIVNDCNIFLDKPIRVPNLHERPVDSKTSTCDYEYDCTLGDLVQTPGDATSSESEDLELSE